MQLPFTVRSTILKPPISTRRLPTLILLAALIGVIGWLLFKAGWGDYLSLGHLKARQAELLRYRDLHPMAVALAFFVGYVIATAMSIPGATVLTLAAGALFGLLWGTVLVSFASTLGAALAFGLSRYVLRDVISARFAGRLRAIDAGLNEQDALYVLSVRLIPVFPFWLVNVLLGVTTLRLATFWWASQLGMLPVTAIYVSVGTQLAKVSSLKDVMSPSMVAGLILLAALPHAARRLPALLRTRRLRSAWPRPRRFDYNLIVIGAGSAGLVSSYIASAVKAKVALVERQAMGGDCLNTGCVPSKALLRSAGLAAEIRRAREHGICAGQDIRVDFTAVMERVDRIRARIAPHDSVERYTALGVDCLAGEATLTSPYTVQVKLDGGGVKTLTARSIVIATGARPVVPNIPGLREVGFVTSETVWSMQALPRRFVVLGGGPIGCELAQAFSRLGATVVLVDQGERLLPREDAQASALLQECLRDEGIELLLNAQAMRCQPSGQGKIMVVRTQEGERTLVCDEILCAVGRRANTSGLGLEDLGIQTTERGTIKVNEKLQTTHANIFACGDVAGPYQFTHMASHQAWYASVNALFGLLHRFRVDYRVTPWVTFTSPEIARVGLTEAEAAAGGVAHEVTTLDVGEIDRAIADGATRGYIKVLTPPGKDRILGVTIVAEHASGLLPEFVLAMRHGIGLSKVLQTIHVYPTYSEAAKQVAGRWRLKHAPQRLLRLSESYLAWLRGR